MPRRELNERFQHHIARARRARIIAGAFLGLCILGGTAAALTQTQLPQQSAAILKPIATIVSSKLSKLPSAISQRIPDIELQLPSGTQLAASATSFTADLTQKVRNLFCRWLECKNATVLVAVTQQPPQKTSPSYAATLPQNVKQPSTSPPPSPTGDAARSATTTSQVVVSNSSPPASNSASRASAPAPVINQPTIERVIETTRTLVQGGISGQLLDARLLALTNDLNSRLNQVALAGAYQTNRTYDVLATALRIEDLTGLTAHDLTVDGVAGLTDADIPDAITASNYLPLSGGSITGDLSIGGNFSANSLSVAGLSSGGAVFAPYFVATSTTATSTFAGFVGIGTTTPWKALSISTTGTADGAIITNSAAGSGATLDIQSTDTNGRIWRFQSLGNVPGRLGSFEIADITGGGSIGLAINSSGNVGIGFATPLARLHIIGSQPTATSSGNGTAASGLFFASGSAGGNTSDTGTRNGGASGAFLVTIAAGGQATAADVSSTGGASGALTFTGGNGGAAAVDGTGNNTGGSSGAFNFTNGTGGAATGNTSGTNTGGNGGGFALTAGTGGAGTNLSGLGNGGTGGAVVISAGTAGVGTTIGGNGGPLTLQGGASAAATSSAGGGVTIAGKAGSTVGSGGAGGALTITGGLAGGDNTVVRAGGAITLMAGASKGQVATGVSSCTVTAPNGDAWSALQSAIGGNTSKPITGETTYTLSCLALDGSTLTKTATVRILPTFQEL